MVPHQIYQVLSQQRSHDLRTNARRHELRTAAQLAPATPSESWSRLKNAVARLATLVHPSTPTTTRGPASGVRATSAPHANSATSTAGPMGCIA